MTRSPLSVLSTASTILSICDTPSNETCSNSFAFWSPCGTHPHTTTGVSFVFALSMTVFIALWLGSFTVHVLTTHTCRRRVIGERVSIFLQLSRHEFGIGVIVRASERLHVHALRSRHDRRRRRRRRRRRADFDVHRPLFGTTMMMFVAHPQKDSAVLVRERAPRHPGGSSVPRCWGRVVLPPQVAQVFQILSLSLSLSLSLVCVCVCVCVCERKKERKKEDPKTKTSFFFFFQWYIFRVSSSKPHGRKKKKI